MYMKLFNVGALCDTGAIRCAEYDECMSRRLQGVGCYLQAALLYLLLCFTPSTLQRDGSLMRTLADRHFADAWVVAWGPGFYTDLAVEWDSFRAARSALAGAVSVSRARDAASNAAAVVPQYRSQLASHLAKGSLSVRSARPPPEPCN